MNPMISQPIAQAQFNMLPVHYTSWLEFYDSLTADLLEEPLLKVREVLTLEQYRQYFGQSPTNGTQVEWHIQRDFYLARVAEALLPSRYSRSELHALTTALHEGSKYTTTGIPNEHAFLNRAWEVARK